MQIYLRFDFLFASNYWDFLRLTVMSNSEEGKQRQNLNSKQLAEIEDPRKILLNR